MHQYGVVLQNIKRKFAVNADRSVTLNANERLATRTLMKLKEKASILQNMHFNQKRLRKQDRYTKEKKRKHAVKKKRGAQTARTDSQARNRQEVHAYYRNCRNLPSSHFTS